MKTTIIEDAKMLYSGYENIQLKNAKKSMRDYEDNPEALLRQALRHSNRKDIYLLEVFKTKAEIDRNLNTVCDILGEGCGHSDVWLSGYFLASIMGSYDFHIVQVSCWLTDIWNTAEDETMPVVIRVYSEDKNNK